MPSSTVDVVGALFKAPFLLSQFRAGSSVAFADGLYVPYREDALKTAQITHTHRPGTAFAPISSSQGFIISGVHRSGMHCSLLIDDRACRRWHAQLAAALGAGRPCSVERLRVEERPSRPAALDLMLLLDRILHGPGEHALDAIKLTGTIDTITSGGVVIDLTEPPRESIATTISGRHFVPLFDGVPGELGLWTALLDGRAPELALRDAETGALIPIGRPALETPQRLQASADAVLARLVEGIARVIRLGLVSPNSLSATITNGQALAPSSFTYAHKTLVGKAQRALKRLLKSAPQWAVAWREAPNGRTWPSDPVLPSGWNVLPDDGQRYFADPFLLAHDGRRFMFVEELPYATGRGIISAFEVGADGRATAAGPVLETPFHLSYPQVFVEDGTIYMLPEAAASGRLTLYRAERLPDRWMPVADLLTEPVHDATLLKHGGLYWLFAGTQVENSSSWDALSLFSAPSLFGPWQAHPANPVLLDSASARPAGAMFSHEGRLWRPAQDCTRDYGSAMTLARIDRLDGTGYAQSALVSWRAPVTSNILGPHTWNTGAGLEVVDLFASRRKLGL